ncbi:hypothetical protein DDZ15_04835 [Rhodohalobacter mucosus]|uniref:Acyl-CoA reductase (LuxC) n=1 Tax=Rhodohalobacter mucosus TaxID=2079485 RepID=A0A316TWH5_9BACT|nr:hypothetical protein DDZ15_04835 [Rhodohalobacter mucosus]
MSDAIHNWLQPDNKHLRKAIERSVDEGLFGLEDIKHRIRHLKQSVDSISLKKWCDKAGLVSPAEKDNVVCCLHAGNIPLVGFHDLLAVLLSGASYRGKLSRKDPYLMVSLLKILADFGLVSKNHWSTSLSQFRSMDADAVLFSGSASSVTPVRKLLKELGIASQETPELIRTAYYSIAWITDNSKETMEELTESVFRYGGNGCRSVAVVVAPFGLNEEKCEFTDYVENFWLKNPQHQKPNPSLSYRFAYNKAVGIEQAWLNDFLIEENLSFPDEKFILQWIKGGRKEIENLVQQSAGSLQSVYSNSEMGRMIGGKAIEPLSLAQKPPVWWKADGVDTIEWLLKTLR